VAHQVEGPSAAVREETECDIEHPEEAVVQGTGQTAPVAGQVELDRAGA
jgi:hypothetical protein